MTTQYRKQDAHEKIQLGGLVCKAGMRDTDKALLLGALIEIAQTIKIGDDEKVRAWTASGAMALAKGN